MNWFFVMTFLFSIISAAMVLIILVQRPQGGGLAGAFGGAGGGGTDTVFGGRVGDALTWGTIICFSLWLLFAIGLNLAPTGAAPAALPEGGVSTPISEVPASEGTTPAPAEPFIPGEPAP
jgi:preprotein translocase subunit SecG